MTNAWLVRVWRAKEITTRVVWGFTVLGIIWTAMTTAVAFTRELPLHWALLLWSSLWFLGTTGLFAAFFFIQEIWWRVLRRRIGQLVLEGEAAEDPSDRDHASWARAIDEWRGHVGKLPVPIRAYVLHDSEGEISVPLERLHAVLGDLRSWIG